MSPAKYEEYSNCAKPWNVLVRVHCTSTLYEYIVRVHCTSTQYEYIHCTSTLHEYIARKQIYKYIVRVHSTVTHSTLCSLTSKLCLPHLIHSVKISLYAYRRKIFSGVHATTKSDSFQVNEIFCKTFVSLSNWNSISYTYSSWLLGMQDTVESEVFLRWSCQNDKIKKPIQNCCLLFNVFITGVMSQYYILKIRCWKFWPGVLL